MLNFICIIFFRESLSAQLELTLTMVDSEQLARSIAEEQVSSNLVIIKDGSTLRKIYNYVFLLFSL